MEPQPHRLLAGGAIHVAGPPSPDPASGTELGDLLEEVKVGVEEEGQPGGKNVDVQAARLAQLEVSETISEGERQLLRGRGSRLPDVIAGDRHRFVGRDRAGGVFHQVTDQPQMRLGRKEPFLLCDVFLEDVRLQGSVERGHVDALSLGGREIHTEDRDRGPADRHRCRDVAQRDVAEEQVHVSSRVDGHAAMPDFSHTLRVIGVTAHQGGHVEGNRQAAAAVGQDHLVALVGLLGVAEASKLPDGPRPPSVSCGVQSASVGELPRPTDPFHPVIDRFDLGAGPVDGRHLRSR